MASFRSYVWLILFSKWKGRGWVACNFISFSFLFFFLFVFFFFRFTLFSFVCPVLSCFINFIFNSYVISYLMYFVIIERKIFLQKKKMFWKGIKEPFKKVYFIFRTQSILIGNVIKNKRGLELVTSHSSGYEISSQKLLD